MYLHEILVRNENKIFRELTSAVFSKRPIKHGSPLSTRSAPPPVPKTIFLENSWRLQG
jgi:hypothetical protein